MHGRIIEPFSSQLLRGGRLGPRVCCISTCSVTQYQTCRLGVAGVVRRGVAEKAPSVACSAVCREKFRTALGPKQMDVGVPDMQARAPAIFRISMANVRGPEVRAW